MPVSSSPQTARTRANRPVETALRTQEAQEEDATRCVLHRGSVDRQLGAQPRQDQSATRPLSQGLQELTEGTSRPQHRELQPAWLHLQSSRGLSQNLLQSVRRGKGSAGGGWRGLAMNSVHLGFLVRIVWKAIVMKYGLFLLNCEAQEYKSQI